MPPSPKDPNDNKGTETETDLRRDSSTSPQSPTEDERENPLPQNSPADTYHDNPMSGAKRGQYNTRASSRLTTSPSTVKGPGQGQTPHLTTASGPRSKLSPKPADKRNAPKKPPSDGSESTLCDVESSSGGENSSDTGSTVTDADVLDNQASRQPSPRTAKVKVKPTTRNAPRARQARKISRRAILYCGWIFGLTVVALTLACATGYESSLVGHQKFCSLVSQAGAGVTFAYIWTQHAVQQLHRCLPALQPSPRHSSGEQLGTGLGHIHTNLSQALAAGDSLFKAPKLISAKRAEAMRFQLPEGSLTSEPLLLFLQQSNCIDEDLLRLILSLGQLSGLALRQHQLTADTLRSIQLVEYFGTYQALRVRFVRTSTQESQLQARLAEHFSLLNEMIISTDQAARDVLQQYVVLTSTTNDVRHSTIQDRQRLLYTKEEAASEWNWLTRASVHMFALSEPEDLAKISQNVDLAQGIHEWAEGVVDMLQRVTLHIKYAKLNVGSLMETLHKYGTVTWDVEDKDRKLQEFLAQVSEGQELLSYNRKGWLQLQYGGYI